MMKDCNQAKIQGARRLQGTSNLQAAKPAAKCGEFVKCNVWMTLGIFKVLTRI